MKSPQRNLAVGRALSAPIRREADFYAEDLQKLFSYLLPALAKPTQQLFIFLTLAGALGLAYFFAARLGLALLTKPDGVAVFWPAAGVASGMLIALGPSARGPVVAGTMAATIVANLLGDRTIWSALVFAVCNAGEAVIVAGLIERYFGSSFSLGRLLHVLGLLGAAVVGTTISGIGGYDRFSLSEFDRTSSFNLAALVYFRRPRHRNGGAVVDRARLLST